MCMKSKQKAFEERKVRFPPTPSGHCRAQRSCCRVRVRAIDFAMGEVLSRKCEGMTSGGQGLLFKIIE